MEFATSVFTPVMPGNASKDTVPPIVTRGLILKIAPINGPPKLLNGCEFAPAIEPALMKIASRKRSANAGFTVKLYESTKNGFPP
jgi:hypothetical protein